MGTFLATRLIAFTGLYALAPTAPAPTSACDRDCLLKVMDRFVTVMAAGKSRAVPLAQDAEIRENTRLLPLDRTAWKNVRTVRSIMTFADPLTGNVLSRAGVELDDGKPGYISTRLKVVDGGRIADVELSSDTSSNVVSGYVWNLDPQYTAIVPTEQRVDRVALEGIARRYFQSFSTHQPVAADFDERCNRFHSGRQITNVPRNATEGGPPRTCVSALEGTPPWGPATEQRFPVIDVEHGIVLGVTLLHYPGLPNQPQMYVSEMFKVVGGKIVRIDNVALMMQDVTTLGFVH